MYTVEPCFFIPKNVFDFFESLKISHVYIRLARNEIIAREGTEFKTKKSGAIVSR